MVCAGRRRTAGEGFRNDNDNMYRPKIKEEEGILRARKKNKHQVLEAGEMEMGGVREVKWSKAGISAGREKSG